MSISIDTSNRISIDGVATGLALAQTSDRTIIFTPESGKQEYKEHSMPFKRYSASTKYPHKIGENYDPLKTAGNIQLETDIKNLLKK